MYLRYLRAVGWGYSFWVAMGYVAQYVAYVGTNLWLSAWTDDAERYQNQTYPVQQRDLRIGVFGALGVSQGECGDTGSAHLSDVAQQGKGLQGLQPAVSSCLLVPSLLLLPGLGTATSTKSEQTDPRRLCCPLMLRTAVCNQFGDVLVPTAFPKG